MNPASNEDKAAWCELYGTDAELAFVRRMFLVGIGVAMSPLKVSDKFGHDLLLTLPADLKTVRTPFFTAAQYKFDPQFTVTLNEKDLQRYTAAYPFCVVVFDVRWDVRDMVVGGDTISVIPMQGVWVATMHEIARAIAKGIAPLHEYAARREDTQGNAKRSYLLNLRWFKELPE